MSFYCLRFPSRRTLMTGLVGAAALVGVYNAWDVARSRRSAVPLFDSAAVVRTEESARYPCQVLRGFDVVVRCYYVSSGIDDSDATFKERRDTMHGRRTTEGSSEDASVSSRFRELVRLFSNETHRADSEADTASRVRKDVAHSLSTRLVVRDAVDAAAAAQKSADAGVPLIAASHWPPHTAKYAALVLQPSTDAEYSDITASRSLLRQLADSATHQSLVRCNPRSVQLDMACEGDPSYLGAPYLRVLLSAFVLLPATLSQLHVAVLGVGGGSLPLFLQHYFASRLHRCDCVDVEPQCFKAAVEQLGLKESLSTVALRREGGGVHYYVDDAMQYLRQRAEGISGLPSNHATEILSETPPLPPPPPQREPSTLVGAVHDVTPIFTAEPHPGSADMSLSRSRKRQNQLDLLFVDLFVGSELNTAVTSVDFLRLCRSVLSPCGVAAFNLPAADMAFAQRCRGVFGKDNVFRIPVPACSNEVVLVRGGVECVSGTVGPHFSHRHLFRRAQELSAQYRLPYDLANHYPVWWRLW